MQKIDSNILFGKATKILNKILESNSFSSIHVLCDENTFRDCWPKIENANWTNAPVPIVIPAGELAKKLATCEDVWKELINTSADRNSLLINLGGGVLTDLGGFCAATYMRGMKFVQIPTTILAMTDAAIGGKVGVDFQLYKNYIGTFAEPEAVIIDTDFIETLIDGEVRNGLAEVIKHGFLADRTLVELLNSSSDIKSLEWHEIVRRSIEIKLKFVQEDQFDRGVRAALNFGHTVGHAIETKQLTTSSPLRHGEAVALGMLVESRVSHHECGLSVEDLILIESTIEKYFGEIVMPEIPLVELQTLILKDKKKVGSEVMYALLKGLGNPVVGQGVRANTVNEAYLHYINN